jgi:hypothetical protein
MSSEPPSDTPAAQGGVGEGLKGGASQLDEPANDGRGIRWVSIGLAAAVLAIAVGAGLYLYRAHGSDTTSEQSTTVRGLACTHLLLAADAYGRDNLIVYRSEIGSASDAAKQTLQTSGELFGKPERIALELALTPDPDPTRVDRLLNTAVQDCQSLGST